MLDRFTSIVNRKDVGSNPAAAANNFFYCRIAQRSRASKNILINSCYLELFKHIKLILDIIYENKVKNQGVKSSEENFKTD